MPGAPRPAAFFDEIHHKIFLKAVFAQHARAERVRFAHDAEQKVLGADVAVAQLHGGGACLFNGVSRLSVNRSFIFVVSFPCRWLTDFPFLNHPKRQSAWF